MRLPLLPLLLLATIAVGAVAGARTYGVLQRNKPNAGRIVPLGSAPLPLAAAGARLDLALALEQRGTLAEVPLSLPDGPGRVRLSKPGADGRYILALLRDEGAAKRVLDAKEIDTLTDPQLSVQPLRDEPQLILVQSTRPGGAPEFLALHRTDTGLEEVQYLYVDAPPAPAKSGSSLAVNLWTNALYYFEAGKLVQTFRVATGKDFLQQATPDNNATPQGLFHVALLEKDPAYVPAAGSVHKEKIAGGDPKNPLGKFLIGLDADPNNPRLWAIHGNIEAGAIGDWASEGCIRLEANNLNWLFQRLAKNTPVRIYRSGP